MTHAPYILVADDDPLVRKSITFILQRAGYSVETAPNGQEALDQIYAKRPTLAILDVMMPLMDGLDVCRTVKGDPTLTDIPVFLVTARAMADERERGLAAGADDYITKPFANQELLERVREIFDAAGVVLPAS